jgi:hypothetical protein
MPKARSLEHEKFDYQKTTFEQETMKPGKMQRRNSEARKPRSDFSWFSGFLLNHVLAGWGAAA